MCIWRLQLIAHYIYHIKVWELLDVIKGEYKTKLQAGEVDLEKDDYGCSGMFVNASGEVQKKVVSAADILGRDGFSNLSLLGSAGSEEGDCGATKKKKRRGNWRTSSSPADHIAAVIGNP